MFCHYKSNSRGVAILMKNCAPTIHKCKGTYDGNFLGLDISLDNIRFSLFTLYGPNNDSPLFYASVHEIIEEFCNPLNVLCGDWNLILDPTLDMVNYQRVNNAKARDRVLSMLDALNPCDPWRIFNPSAQS